MQRFISTDILEKYNYYNARPYVISIFYVKEQKYDYNKWCYTTKLWDQAMMFIANEWFAKTSITALGLNYNYLPLQRTLYTNVPRSVISPFFLITITPVIEYHVYIRRVSSKLNCIGMCKM